ncbi:hypothetical protein EON79_22670, partial [bacterium]
GARVERDGLRARRAGDRAEAVGFVDSVVHRGLQHLIVARPKRLRDEHGTPNVEDRAALPPHYTRSDAIFNIGRAMLVAEALRAGDDEMLKAAMNDRIHEPYRLGAIPGAAGAKSVALDAGALCVALSGAGPGIIAFAREGYDRIGRSMKDAFAAVGLQSRYWILDATEKGTHVGRLPV